MKTAADIENLRAAGIRLTVCYGVHHAGPAALLTDDIRSTIAPRRDEILAQLHNWPSGRERERDGERELQEAKETIDRLLLKRVWALERLQELEETIAELKREIESLKVDANLSQLFADGCQMQYQRLLARQTSTPGDTHRTLVSLCHPDHNQNRQATAPWRQPG